MPARPARAAKKAQGHASAARRRKDGQAGGAEIGQTARLSGEESYHEPVSLSAGGADLGYHLDRHRAATGHSAGGRVHLLALRRS